MLVSHQTLMALKRPVHIRVGSSCQELVDAARVVDCTSRTAGVWLTCLGDCYIPILLDRDLSALAVSLRKLRPSSRNRREAALWTLRMDRVFPRHSRTRRSRRNAGSRRLPEIGGDHA